MKSVFVGGKRLEGGENAFKIFLFQDFNDD